MLLRPPVPPHPLMLLRPPVLPRPLMLLRPPDEDTIYYRSGSYNEAAQSYEEYLVMLKVGEDESQKIPLDFGEDSSIQQIAMDRDGSFLAVLSRYVYDEGKTGEAGEAAGEEEDAEVLEGTEVSEDVEVSEGAEVPEDGEASEDAEVPEDGEASEDAEAPVFRHIYKFLLRRRIIRFGAAAARRLYSHSSQQNRQYRFFPI